MDSSDLWQLRELDEEIGRMKRTCAEPGKGYGKSSGAQALLSLSTLWIVVQSAIAAGYPWPP